MSQKPSSSLAPMSAEKIIKYAKSYIAHVEQWRREVYEKAFKQEKARLQQPSWWQKKRGITIEVTDEQVKNSLDSFEDYEKDWKILAGTWVDRANQLITAAHFSEDGIVYTSLEDCDILNIGLKNSVPLKQNEI